MALVHASAIFVVANIVVASTQAKTAHKRLLWTVMCPENVLIAMGNIMHILICANTTQRTEGKKICGKAFSSNPPAGSSPCCP